MPNLTSIDHDGRRVQRLVTQFRGRKLPSERALATQLGLSARRVRMVLDHLEAQGVVARHQRDLLDAIDTDTTAVDGVTIVVDEDLASEAGAFVSAVVEHIQHACNAAEIPCAVARHNEYDETEVSGCLIGIGPATRERLIRSNCAAVGLLVSIEPQPCGQVSTLEPACLWERNQLHVSTMATDAAAELTRLTRSKAVCGRRI